MRAKQVHFQTSQRKTDFCNLLQHRRFSMTRSLFKSPEEEFFASIRELQSLPLNTGRLRALVNRLVEISSRERFSVPEVCLRSEFAFVCEELLSQSSVLENTEFAFFLANLFENTDFRNKVGLTLLGSIGDALVSPDLCFQVKKALFDLLFKGALSPLVAKEIIEKVNLSSLSREFVDSPNLILEFWERLIPHFQKTKLARAISLCRSLKELFILIETLLENEKGFPAQVQSIKKRKLVLISLSVFSLHCHPDFKTIAEEIAKLDFLSLIFKYLALCGPEDESIICLCSQSLSLYFSSLNSESVSKEFQKNEQNFDFLFSLLAIDGLDSKTLRSILTLAENLIVQSKEVAAKLIQKELDGFAIEACRGRHELVKQVLGILIFSASFCSENLRPRGEKVFLFLSLIEGSSLFGQIEREKVKELKAFFFASAT